MLAKHGLKHRIIKVTDPDDPTVTKKVRRQGFWFHVDGALGAI